MVIYVSPSVYIEKSFSFFLRAFSLSLAHSLFPLCHPLTRIRPFLCVLLFIAIDNWFLLWSYLKQFLTHDNFVYIPGDGVYLFCSKFIHSNTFLCVCVCVSGRQKQKLIVLMFFSSRLCFIFNFIIMVSSVAFLLWLSHHFIGHFRLILIIYWHRIY